MTRPNATDDVPRPYDHVRPGEGGPSTVGPGVYRVVGVANDAVTLLRVADSDGERRHTGDLVRVPPAELASFDRVENPDANQSLASRLAGAVDGALWSFRLLGRTAVDRPIPGAIALALVAVGLFGDPFVDVPEVADALLAVAGVFLLVVLSRSSA